MNEGVRITAASGGYGRVEALFVGDRIRVESVAPDRCPRAAQGVRVEVVERASGGEKPGA